ncbi:beta-N-acetylhexosaminidase [bacterium]|nr:MAG: beta-N-acetylhexosaminidase [bacterium]
MPSPFLFGFEGTTASKATVRLLRDTDAAGILLLARNITSPKQVKGLVRDLEQKVGRRLIVSIDHEGGWVMRFSSGVTFLPGNGALGRAGREDWAEQAGAVMGRELAALGVNFNLAPVLDVLGPGYNPGIGIRSFGRFPELVGRLGAAFIRGQEGHGVAACAKHFPGKGAAKVDAHVDLPLIKLTPKELESHLAPFRCAVSAGVASVMTSHVLMPAVDKLAPATFSRKAVHGLLRRRLGYRGVIISDDLCMGAVTKRMPVGEAAVSALAAGHDLLIVAHGEALMREAHEAVGMALEGGLLPPGERRALDARLAGFLRRWAKGAKGSSPAPDAALARDISTAAVETLRIGRKTLPLRWPAWVRPKVLAVWPDLREVRERFALEGGIEAPGRRVRAALSRWPAKLSWALSPVASEKVPGGLAAAAKKADLVISFCFEARRFPGQAAALAVLRKAAGAKLVAVLLRSPEDLDLLGPESSALTAHGYRDCQVDALLAALR